MADRQGSTGTDLRAIDFHVHPPVPEWLDGSMRGYMEAAEAYFRSSVAPKTLPATS